MPDKDLTEKKNNVKYHYPLINLLGTDKLGSISFPRLEKTVLNFWNKEKIFQKSLMNRIDEKEFIFYDGPPFANGLPHYGHLLTGYVKDIIPRFYTMRGFLVDRRFGWDCHGLPAELEAERQLGIKDKAEIDAMGLQKFNEYCRESVLKYAQQWRDYVVRQGRWVDLDNDYKTMDINFMESVIWAFKKLYDEGLIYTGYRVVPYSWYEQTALSNHETRLDDSYRLRQDPAVTVCMPIKSPDSILDNVNVLIWTTTPWTLPTNLAIAVNPELNYVVVAQAENKYLLCETRLTQYKKELGDNPKTIASFTGEQLIGLSYQPPFDFFTDLPNAHKIIAAKYVTADSGTGLVHIAPAFGEEDLECAQKNDIPVVQPLDSAGRFTDTVPDYKGLQVFDANSKIIKDLKTVNKIFRHETIEHSYPHSWRSGKPLIYMAVPAWFLAVSKFKDEMIRLNHNIEWFPEHLRDGQFGNWLEGAKDWNISRSRYWGAPIPVWVSDDPNYPRIDVYGSLDELEADFGIRPVDLHRPYIDELVRKNPDDPTGKSFMRRVPEVLDGWFESGAMPFAQVHYPFENKTWFENHYPGDFIVEYIAQTRGWFYTMHVLATALFKRSAFRQVLAHGVILGDDGQKMSKSKRNYVDVNLIFDKYGSDAMRWFLMSSPVVVGGAISVSEQAIKEGLRQAILPLYNAFSFLQLYAEINAEWRVDSNHILDQYIFAKLAQCRNDLTCALESIDIPKANLIIRNFLEVLTNWYIRRSRERFWLGQTQQKAAFDTLYTVLEILFRLTAPLLPFVSEALWKGLTGNLSVHLTDWPAADLIPINDSLAKNMDQVREICSAALKIRKDHNLRVRLPLNKLTIIHQRYSNLIEFQEIIAEEINVKSIVFSDDIDSFSTKKLNINAKILGPRIGGKVQEIIKAAKAGDWTFTKNDIRESVLILDEVLQSDEYSLDLVVNDPENTVLLKNNQGLVILDTEVTADLADEGWVNDRTRELQQARKDLSLEVSDRIKINISVPQEKVRILQKYQNLIAAEVLATEFNIGTVSKTALSLSEGVFVDIVKVNA